MRPDLEDAAYVLYYALTEEAADDLASMNIAATAMGIMLGEAGHPNGSAVRMGRIAEMASRAISSTQPSPPPGRQRTVSPCSWRPGDKRTVVFSAKRRAHF
jgi:hypothetical protein